MVVIIFGLPGSGKSYFAEQLAARLNTQYLNTDRIRNEMYPRKKYSGRKKRSVYQEMLRQATEHLKNGKAVVIDGTFYKNQIRNEFKKIDIPVYWIEVTAEESTIRKRLAKPRPYSDADFEIYKMIERQWEPMVSNHLILKSNDSNIEPMLNEASHYLKYDKR